MTDEQIAELRATIQRQAERLREAEADTETAQKSAAACYLRLRALEEAARAVLSMRGNGAENLKRLAAALEAK